MEDKIDQVTKAAECGMHWFFEKRRGKTGYIISCKRKCFRKA